MAMKKKKAGQGLPPEFKNKTAYVLSFDDSRPAIEVVDIAAKRGVVLSLAQVYNIRSVAKKKGNGMKTGVPKRQRDEIMSASKKVKARAVHPRKKRAVPSDRNPANDVYAVKATVRFASPELRAVIAEAGFARVRQVLAEMEAAVSTTV